MPKNNKIKILCLLIIGIVFLYIYGPIAFMKRWVSNETECKFF